MCTGIAVASKQNVYVLEYVYRICYIGHRRDRLCLRDGRSVGNAGITAAAAALLLLFALLSSSSSSTSSFHSTPSPLHTNTNRRKHYPSSSLDGKYDPRAAATTATRQSSNGSDGGNSRVLCLTRLRLPYTISHSHTNTQLLLYA